MYFLYRFSKRVTTFQVPYTNLEEAKDGVTHGKVVGVIYMSHNFSESAERRYQDGKDAENETLDFSEIKVWMDMSSKCFI